MINGNKSKMMFLVVPFIIVSAHCHAIVCGKKAHNLFG